MIISEEKIVAARDELLEIIKECRKNANLPGRSEGLISSDHITAALAAAQLDALQFVLNEFPSPMMRSKLLKR
jgi:hypothetical protein